MSHISSRRCDLDWLRIAAFALLILYHAGMLFVPWDFHIKLARLDWLEPVMRFSNAWRMSLLFLISGVASAAMLARSPTGFLNNRSRRLLLPLLFGIAVVVPPQSWVELQANGRWQGSYSDFWFTQYFQFSDRLGPILPTWNHLWFVAYLWVYTLVLALVWPRLRPGAGSALLAGNRLILLPMAALALINMGLSDAWPESHDLVNDLRAHLIYGGAFAIGCCLSVDGPLWPVIDRWWPRALLIGVAGWLIVEAILLLHPGPPAGAVLAFGRGLRSVQGWAMIIGLLGAARRWLAFDHRWRQPLTEAVFPAYLIHQTLIILIAWWARGQGTGTQALLVLVGTLLGTGLFCLAAARLTWLRQFVGYGPIKSAVVPARLRA